MQICVDLFVTSQGYVDLATLRDLCHLTAGQLYHYHPFSPALDTDQLTNDLRWNVVRPQVGSSPAEKEACQGVVDEILCCEEVCNSITHDACSCVSSSL